MKTEYEKFLEYEREKNKLRMLPLTDKEYERELKRIADKLGI